MMYDTSLLIWAGMLAKSGLLANVDRFSTAARSGVVATLHLFLFSSEKSPSKAWNDRTPYETILSVPTDSVDWHAPSFPRYEKDAVTSFHSTFWSLGELTLMVLTRLAVVLATSLADWTNCLLATGLEVLEEARRQALHRADVCLATIVAADRTWGEIQKTVLNDTSGWCVRTSGVDYLRHLGQYQCFTFSVLSVYTLKVHRFLPRTTNRKLHLLETLNDPICLCTSALCWECPASHSAGTDSSSLWPCSVSIVSLSNLITVPSTVTICLLMGCNHTWGILPVRDYCLGPLSSDKPSV